MRVTAIQATLAVAVIAAVGLAAIELTTRPIDEAALDSIWREDLNWTAANLRFETARLALALADLARDPSAAHRDAVLLRADMLWSRIALMESGVVGERLRALDVAGARRALVALLERWDDRVAALAAGGALDAAAMAQDLAATLPGLQAYVASVGDFEEMRFAAVHDAVKRHNRLSVIVALSALAIVAVLALGAAAQKRDAAARLRSQRLQTERAQRAARARSRFLTMMSHELRTPMNGVVGLLSVLDRRSLDGRQALLVDTAAQSAAAMAQLVDDLLDLSDLETTDAPPQRETITVASLAARLQAAAGGRLRAGVCVLEMGHDDPRMIRATARCLEKLAAQLALHLQDGADAPGLTLRVRLEGAALCLSVAAPARGDALGRAGALFGGAGGAPDEIETDRIGPLLTRALLRRGGARGQASMEADGALRLTVRWPVAPPPAETRDPARDPARETAGDGAPLRMAG